MQKNRFKFQLQDPSVRIYLLLKNIFANVKTYAKCYGEYLPSENREKSNILNTMSFSKCTMYI